MTTKEFLFKEVSTKKSLVLFLILMFLLGILIIREARKIDSQKLITGFIGNEEKAILSLSPETNTYNIGDEFSVDVLVDTKGEKVVAVGAYLNYDSTKLEVISINTNNSVFGQGYELINYNGSVSYTPPGKIEIVKALPSPGVQTNKGLVATIFLKALAETTPLQDNLFFDFTSAYASGDSDLILDDGKGTDILSGVRNARYTIRITKKINLKIEMEGKMVFTTPLTLIVLEQNTNNVVFQTESESGDLGDLEINVPLASGSYDLKVVIPNYLDKKITNVTLPIEEEIEFGPLPAGDLSQDNVINSLDWSVMRNDWGKSNVASDINEDGIVNTIDWSFLNKNWNREGD